MAMRRTVIELDQTLLDRAKEVLGTSTIKETVNRALQQVLVAEAREDLLAQLTTADGLDLDPGVREAAWR